MKHHKSYIETISKRHSNSSISTTSRTSMHNWSTRCPPHNIRWKHKEYIRTTRFFTFSSLNQFTYLFHSSHYLTFITSELWTFRMTSLCLTNLPHSTLCPCFQDQPELHHCKSSLPNTNLLMVLQVRCTYTLLITLPIHNFALTTPKDSNSRSPHCIPICMTYKSTPYSPKRTFTYNIISV